MLQQWGGEQEEGVQLEIASIEHIVIKIPQGEVPRSKCWKVTVPAKFREHMARGEAYPAVWRWRKWSRGPLQYKAGGEARGQGGSDVNGGA